MNTGSIECSIKVTHEEGVNGKTSSSLSDEQQGFQKNHILPFSSSKSSSYVGLENEAGPSEPSHITGMSTVTEIVPSVPNHVIPKKGHTYSSLEEAIDMYRQYARLSGFKVRLCSTNFHEDMSLQSKYVRCNRHGNNQGKKFSLDQINTESKTRTSSIKVTGCQARVKIDRDMKTGEFKIDVFEPIHNHPLLESLDVHTAISDNTLSYLDKDFIMKVSTLNIGATRVFNLHACLKGGYHRIRTSKTAFKNFWRNFISMIGQNDAGCVVDQLSIRKRTYPNFFFKYNLKGAVLHSLFWADEVAQENYSKFSDVISIDATYHTNRYNMIFVPFTAINNQNKSINVGAALLSDESIESYSWLLQTFLDVHGHPPNLVLTDQDPALTQAISKIFKDSTHRLCMWHIMSKLPGKMSKDVYEDISFKKCIHKLVWDINLNVGQFEEQWRSMISKFHLSENKWLHDMYELRESWIPAFFRHIPMCGLMKTTSRSESANSFFNVFTNHRSLLVNFMFNFDSAITKQRYDQYQVETSGNSSTPAMSSNKYIRNLELHAASVYTRAIFRKVQKEITKGSDQYFQHTSVEYENRQECTIVYKNPKGPTRPKYQVTVGDSNNYVECSCRCFNNFGYLCCHAFCVLINNDVKQIPSNYIAKRWKKNVTDISQATKNQKWGVFNNATSFLVEELTFYFERCVEKVVHDNATLEDLLSKFKELDLSLGNGKSSTVEIDKTRQFVEQAIGLKLGNTSQIQNPSIITNKGGNRTSRMIGAKEKAVRAAEKKKRECKACHQIANHDSRNCPLNPSKKLKPHKKIKK